MRAVRTAGRQKRRPKLALPEQSPVVKTKPARLGHSVALRRLVGRVGRSLRHTCQFWSFGAPVWRAVALRVLATRALHVPVRAGMLVHTPHNLTAFTRAVLAEHDAFFVDPLVGHRALGRLLQTPYPLLSLEFA